ncbi:MAG: hypothetical protein EBV03_07785 [Proteobacteria bacterium]|nr:hypothetical protein [Pseudomonadota bacterium]
MEAWKLQSLVVEFTNACDDRSSAIVGHAKKLSRAYDKLRDWEQQKDVLDQLVPYLDDKHPGVRQLTASIIMGTPITRFCAMPEKLDIMLRDSQGEVRHRVRWTNNFPQAEQQQGWMMFVVQQMMGKDERRSER